MTDKRIRLPILVSIVTLAGVVATIGAALYWKHPRGESATAARDSQWQPPSQTFLASRMNARPASGWTVRIGDVGLPAGSSFVTNVDAAWSHPFIGSSGSHAFLLASSPDGAGSQWWLVGIDGRSGAGLFAPVRLDAGSTPPACFVNGPDVVLCVREDAASVAPRGGGTAWVTDTRSGTVSYSGPTDLRTSPGPLRVTQVGTYAVAETTGQGVYGIGPRAETTWFVPGKGQVADRLPAASNVTQETLATQEAGADESTVFSLADGMVVSPELEAGLHTRSAVAYPGGFAMEVVASESKSLPDGIEFFDEAGRKRGRAETSDFLSTTSMDIPIVESAPDSTVFSPSGGKLADIARFQPGDNALLIGAVLFVSGPSSGGSSQSYDLSTGTKGKACPFSLADYVATDGTVGIFDSGNPNVGLVTKAVNLSTCDALWSIDSPVGSFRDVWRVGDTLIQLSDDGTELMSLVAAP